MGKHHRLVEAFDRMDIRQSIEANAPMTIRRFREAVRTANPQISDGQLEVYTENFAAEIPNLTDITFSEYLGTVARTLTDQELDVLCDFSSHPNIRTFLGILERNSASMAAAVQRVMREEGVAAHKRSFEIAVSMGDATAASE